MLLYNYNLNAVNAIILLSNCRLTALQTMAVLVQNIQHCLSRPGLPLKISSHQIPHDPGLDLLKEDWTRDRGFGAVTQPLRHSVGHTNNNFVIYGYS